MTSAQDPRRDLIFRGVAPSGSLAFGAPNCSKVHSAGAALEQLESGARLVSSAESLWRARSSPLLRARPFFMVSTVFSRVFI